MQPCTALTNLRLKDRLSRLTYPRACTLLGPEGPKLIQAGGKWEIDLDQHVKLTDDRFTLSLRRRRRDDHDGPSRKGQTGVALLVMP